jgi:hypothetical protein
VSLWLQFTLLSLLALAAWITGIDNNSAAESSWLWVATACAGAHFLFRLMRGAR